MRTVTIQAKNGLHARPAAELVKLAAASEGDVTIIKGDKEVSAKSIMRLMSLGILQGDEVGIKADDAELADTLADFLEKME
ncbi:MAG TPA: HPr family phosphocarrier protein [Tissierellia bacterium]|nr:HPr family phosphocarrier protein [Tissierellia bacterium]